MFSTKNIYINIYIYPELLSYRNTRPVIICLQNIFLTLSSIQMWVRSIGLTLGPPVTHCALEALGECLQSWDVVFLFVLQIKCLSKNDVTADREDFALLVNMQCVLYLRTCGSITWLNVINLSIITATFRGIRGVARMISNPVIKSINYRIYCSTFQHLEVLLL